MKFTYTAFSGKFLLTSFLLGEALDKLQSDMKQKKVRGTGMNK